jgi:hypothetical protein
MHMSAMMHCCHGCSNILAICCNMVVVRDCNGPVSALVGYTVRLSTINSQQRVCKRQTRRKAVWVESIFAVGFDRHSLRPSGAVQAGHACGAQRRGRARADAAQLVLVHQYTPCGRSLANPGEGGGATYSPLSLQMHTSSSGVRAPDGLLPVLHHADALHARMDARWEGRASAASGASGAG